MRTGIDLETGKAFVTGAVAEEVKKTGRKATTFTADVTKRDQVYAASGYRRS